MRIVVCVKQVPEVSELDLDPVTKRLRREGLPALINPFDRRAVLEATRLVGENDGSLTVLSMGPPQAAQALRECLTLGANRAVHLCDPRFAGADTLATARALARATQRIGCDLVLAGRFSIDSETGQVGPEVAALLGMPLLSGVRRLAIVRTESGALVARAECERDDGFAEVECALPAVITCTDRWKTRVPLVMPEEERATTIAIETWTVDDLGGGADDYGLAGSPTWVAAIQQVEHPRRREILVAEAELDAAVTATLAEIEKVRSASVQAPQRRAVGHRRDEEVRGAVWVLAEGDPEGRLRPVTAELLGAADLLAGQLGVGVCAFVLESHDRPVHDAAVRRDAARADAVPPLAAELGGLGADCLLHVPGEARDEAAMVAALEEAIRTLAPRIVLAPASGLGRELVPRIAARLGLGLTGDAIGVELDEEGRLRQLKPAFGGQFVAPILSRTRPEMVTLRPGVLHAVDPDRVRPAARLVEIASASAAPDPVRRLSWTAEVGSGAAIDEAALIVCVGHGLGSKDHLPRVEALAAALGGVVGGTRRVCDVGWLPRQLQIGISGRSVAPTVYLGLGVRGSFNHLVGMQRAGLVIAVNRDRDADIFAGSDLGIVADALAFVDALLARLRAAR